MDEPIPLLPCQHPWASHLAEPSDVLRVAALLLKVTPPRPGRLAEPIKAGSQAS